MAAMNTHFPPLFVSHGSPMIALEPGDTGAFLQRLGRTLDAHWGRPRAVLAVSAHTTAREPVLLGADRHQAVTMELVVLALKREMLKMGRLVNNAAFILDD